MTYYIANLGRRLLGENPLPIPKNGSQFHFSLPGSTQGFHITEKSDESIFVSVNNINFGDSKALELRFNKLFNKGYFVITTPTFANIDVLKMRTYELIATPLIYPGQILKSHIFADEENNCELIVCFRINYYGENNILINKDSDETILAPGINSILTWKIPDCDSNPISEVGIIVKSKTKDGEGRLIIDYLSWKGKPKLTLKKPNCSSDFWHRAWINGVDNFSKDSPHGFTISQNEGLGLISHGTKDWKNYTIKSTILTHLGEFSGLIGRFQGMRRFYAARICYFKQLFQIIRIYDDNITILGSKKFVFNFEENVPIVFEFKNNRITASIRNILLSVHDDSSEYLDSGGIGLFVYEGSVSAKTISVS